MIRFLLDFEQAGINMKFIRFGIVTGVAIAAFTVGAAAQKSKTPAKRPPAPATTVTNALEIKDGTDKVSVQLKNVTKFLYALGGIASGIEQIDKDAKTKTIARAALDLNQSNKLKVMQAIRNLRAGIATLEVEFRTKPPLKKYLLQLQGITQLSAECEDLATAGSFSESGKPLLALIEKLVDTLAALP